MESNLKALILIAGKGDRMGSLTKTTHKSILLVGKYPLLWYSISNILEAGINEIILVVGYKSRQIHELVKKYFPDKNIKFIYNRKFLSTDSIYSYYLARDLIKGESYIRLEGDIFYTKNILERLIKSNKSIVSMVEKKTKKSMEEYSVSIGRRNKIIKYGKNIPINKSYGEAKGIEFVSKEGSYKIVMSLIDLIKQKRYREYAEICYQNLIDIRNNVYYLKLKKDEYWFEMDTPSDLKVIKEFISQKNNL